MAGLLKYNSVKRCQNEDSNDERKSNCLCDPNGELNKMMLTFSIKTTDMVVHDHELLEENHLHGFFIYCSPEVCHW